MVRNSKFTEVLNYILGDDQYVTLEQKRVNGICFFIAMAFFIAMPLNYILELPRIIIFSCLFFGILHCLYYYFSRLKGKFREVFWFLVFSSGVFVCLTWFYNGGISGAAIMISLISIALINLISRGRQQVGAILLILILQGTLLIIEYYFPETTIPYESRSDRFIDTYFTFVIAVCITSMVITNIMVNFMEEREKARKTGIKLKESEYLFRMLAETTSTAIMLYQDHRYVYANPAAEQLCGYSIRELKKMNFWDLAAPEFKEEIKKIGIKREPLSDPIAGYEVRINTKTGEAKLVYIDGSPIEYYGKPAGLVSMTDITKLKQAEKDLQQLRNYLSSIIDSMPSMLIGVDEAIHVTQWNKHAEDQTGVSAKNILGKSLFHILPRLEIEGQKIKTAIFEQKIQKNIRLVRQNNGQAFYEDVTVYPLMEKGFKGAVIRIDEVTEKVRLEEMVIQSEKMLSIGGLAAGMAHEINNPLAGILQSAQVIENRLTKDLPVNDTAAAAAGTSMDTIRDFMERRNILQHLSNIHKAGDRAAGIVSNMLSFARKGSYEKIPHQLPDLLEKTIELAKSDYDLKTHYDFKQIQINYDFDMDLPKVMCEEVKIIQVLFNIISNAAQAMHSNEKKQEAPRFVFRIKKAGSMGQVEIEDNGPGMDEDTRKRIFEPFFTTKDVDKGTGLGLSLSYFIIVEGHNGEMEVESSPGNWTRFIIRLPFN